MHRIEISVTISRTDIENQFKGVITFKNEANKVKFDYLCTNLKEEEINVELSNQTEKFNLKGIPSKELFETLTDNQKLIFAMSVGPLSDAILSNQSLSLSHETTQTLRMFGGDISGEINCTIEVGDKEYSCLFGK
jgi:hypothetical protein